MEKFDLKKKIKEMIQSDSELKKDYDILLKNKIGYMTNKVHEHCNSQDNKYVADDTRYFIANSDKNTKEVYSNIINYKLKSKLRNSFGNLTDGDFDRAMRETLDDLAEKSD